MLVLEPGAKPLEVRLIRARPLGREQFVNIPSPNSACYVCHRNFDGEKISKKHLEEEVSCATCHGPSLAHRSDEDNVTTPDVMFTRGEVEGACLRCHKRHKAEKKRKDGKEERLATLVKHRSQPEGRAIKFFITPSGVE